MMLGRFGNRNGILSGYGLSGRKDIARPSLRDIFYVLKHASRKGISLFSKFRRLFS